jgi:hypothetical protein
MQERYVQATSVHLDHRLPEPREESNPIDNAWTSFSSAGRYDSCKLDRILLSTCEPCPVHAFSEPRMPLRDA